MPAPLLTVAIPTCNGAPHLAETLDSILHQEGATFDLIVSDDASDDETLALVRERAGERRIVANDRRLGLAGNWNQCAAFCRTPFLAIVHQDDVLLPGHLSEHLRAFQADLRIGLVTSGSTVIDEQGQDVPLDVVESGGLGPEDRTFEPGELIASFARSNPLRCSAVSFRVEAHRDVGGFDPSLRYVVDWDFWYRVALRWRVAWLARPTVQVRWHAASETHRFKGGRGDLDEARRLIDQVLSQAPAGPHERRQLRRHGHARLARAFLNRAHDALRGGRLELSRACLDEALGLSPRILGTILADPRLAVQMAFLKVAPRLARRWFAESE